MNRAGELVLALSTSSARGSVAVARVLESGACEPLAEVVYEGLEAHAERVLAVADEALAAAGVVRRAIGCVACDVGPGSFTGVRVGVATARGMAIGLGARLVGAGSLEAMASEALARDPAAVAVAALDAKRGDLYVAAHGPGLVVARPPTLVAREGFAAWLAAVRDEAGGARLVLAGEVLAELGGVALAGLGLELERGPELDLPHARSVARLAARAGEGADVEPAYVRDADVSQPKPKAVR